MWVGPNSGDRGRPAAGSRRRRLLFWLGCSALSVALLGVAWIVVTGLLARARLDDVQADLPRLRQAIAAGNVAGARQIGDDIAAKTRSAHSLTSGAAWWIAAHVPRVGSPLQTTRTVTSQLDQIGERALPGVLRLAGALSDRPATGSSVDVSTLVHAQPTLATAALTTHEATRAIAGTSSSWLPAVSSARGSLLTKLTRLDGELRSADQALRTALPMLGTTAPKRYFIGFMNEAEARGTGGIPGQFAIATVDHGRLRFTHFGTDDDLRGVRADVHLNAEFDARYKQDDPTGFFQNSNVSPDFRYAGEIWAGMWEKKSGERVDGAIAIDPTALSYLLKVSGPARLPNGSPVSAANVVSLTQQRQYTMFNYTPQGQRERKTYLSAVARAISTRLSQIHSPERLVSATSRAARERRLVLWSADSAIERRLVASNWAGAVAPAPGTPLSGFVVTNASGGKLDYYLHRSMTYSRTGCDSTGRTHATFTVSNGAPRTGLPAYVTTRKDAAPAGARPGDERLLVTYYAGAGARITAVAVDNQPTTVASAPENGLVTATLSLEIPAGVTRTISLTVVGPEATSNAMILRQPGVEPLSVQVDQPECSDASA